MRVIMFAAAAALILMGLPAATEAAPAAPHETTVGASQPTLIRDGCGRGWHARWWRDRWGRPHRRCVPNRY